MTVKELIEELTKLPLELDVMIASDEEGNSFRNLWEIEVHKWDGEDPVHPEDVADCEEDGITLDEVVIAW